MEIKNEFKKGINFFQKGNYGEAKKIYEQILIENPNLAEVHYNLGIVLKILDNLEEAEKSFARAISLKTDFIHAHYHMGNTKYKLKKFDELDYPAKPRWSLDENAIFLKGAGVKL